MLKRAMLLLTDPMGILMLVLEDSWVWCCVLAFDYEGDLANFDSCGG